ncbi:uncharacterized protein LOC143275630 isoform X2 [Babylonia areolata]|uniref:uncharacterized protein LOC143275630 isoform X2 n=1 Tax=Babylonia areolata TaxID=304850 RepID=UPI003FD24BA8
MADRPQGIENMAVSSDASASQHSLKDTEKDDSEFRSNQSYPKIEAPKKKTTFKITSVTKSSQRGGSGDLTQDNDLDSQDDLDETVDSHTEDLSSEIYDTNSKATDVDVQDPLLTPEEVIRESEPKEKPARFKVVKVETKEPFRRGRWLCYDYLDAPDKMENKQEEINVNSGSSSAANSVHYVHGVDDPSKNPLLAGATGTLPSLQQPMPGDVSSAKLQGEGLQQQASSSQPGLTPVSQTNSSFANHVAMSSVPAPYGAPLGVTGQTVGQSMRVVGSVTNMNQPQLSQTTSGQSMPGNAPYPSGQSQPIPTPQASSIPASVHSQPASMPVSVTASQPMPPGAMQTGEYMNSMGQGQVSVPGQQVLPPQQPGLQDMPQQSAYAINAGGGVASMHPPQNHPSSQASQLADGFGSDVDVSGLGGPNLSNVGIVQEGEDTTTALGAGLEPLQIAVGGITSTAASDEVTEETLSVYGGSDLFLPGLEMRRGSSTVAIDNKIEQAMDLVKSHLMYAVREEVEVLKEQIKELMERLHKLEQENKVLRSEASPETLQKLPAPLPPIQNPLLQQLMTSLHNPSSSSSSS